MKFKVLFLVYFIASNLIFCQPIKKPDFFKIQTEIKNPNSAFYLPKLLSRYNKMETSMSVEEIHYLYYGYRMMNNYNTLPYETKSEKIKYLNTSKVSSEEALQICEIELQKDIFDMDFFNEKSVNQYELKKDKNLSEKQFNFYYNFCKSIHKTGTGLNPQNPIYIININHIDFLANLIGYKTNGQNKIKNNILIVGLQKNTFGTTDLFFDITLTKEFNPTITERSFTPMASANSFASVQPTVIKTEVTNEDDTPKSNITLSSDDKLKRREELLAERKRITEERMLAKQKLMEERAIAREQLLENKKLIRERLMQQREELKKSVN